MQRHHQPVDPNNLHAILVKDAVYNAVGLAAFDLYDEVRTKYHKKISVNSQSSSLSRFYLLGKF